MIPKPPLSPLYSADADTVRPRRRPLGVKLRLVRVLTSRLPRSTAQRHAVFSRLFLSMTRRGPQLSQGVVHTHVRGFAMQLDPTDFVDRAMLLFPQLYDHRELGFVHDTLRPGSVFLDIGAHLGLYSLVASRRVGSSGHVIAVEADPTTYARLCHTVLVNRATNVCTLNVGVSDKAGLLRFGLASPPLRAASSFLRVGDEAIDVPALPLLTLLQEQQISRVDGAKFDIEGYEYRVLRRFLADADPALWPRFIVTEFHADMLEQAGGNSIDLLKDHGYRLVSTVDVNSILVRDP